MASILVYIETVGDSAAAEVHPGSLRVLGEARRIASALGATLCACIPVLNETTGDADLAGIGGYEQLVDLLGRGGADKVVAVPVPTWTAPLRWDLHGEALYSAYERVQPLLVLLAATPSARDLAPRLAARAKALFFAEPAIQARPRSNVVLAQRIYGNRIQRRLPLIELEGPAVVTLAAGAYRRARGDADADVVLLGQTQAPGPCFDYVDNTEDPGAALDNAPVIVTAGGGVSSPETYALVGELAAALGGEVGATRSLCARGLAPMHREIGVGVRHVSPSLYVACAASGSRSHLDAVAAGAHIVAINSDPEAPVFRAARHGIVGNLEQVVPDLIRALEGRSPAAVPW